MPVMITSETFDFASTSTRVYLDNGFLKVTGVAARTGVYQYLASELGLTDRPASEIVSVYRATEEVFSVDSLSSYKNVDVTNNHPSRLVDSKNYKAVSVGLVLSAVQVGDFVSVEMIIKDADAILAVETGRVQLSPGYTAVYIMEDGIAPDNTKYHRQSQRLYHKGSRNPFCLVLKFCYTVEGQRPGPHMQNHGLLCYHLIRS